MSRIVLVHLSDIHMGSVRNGFYTPTQNRAGWNGHDPLLCRSLQNAIRNLQTALKLPTEVKPFLIVSGDLSCVGLRTDFTLAHTYLNQALLTDGLTNPSWGLGIPVNRLATVPGNHDHWAGGWSYPQRAYDRAIFPDLFRQTPWPETLASSDGKLELDLFGVDSNSGFATRRVNRNFRAGGRFSPNELDAIMANTPLGLKQLLLDSVDREKRLTQNGIHQVRAVICHHSFNNKGRWQPSASFLAKLKSAGKRTKQKLMSYLIGQCPDPLEQPSVNALLNLAWDYRVKAVLTGHTHYFWEERYPSPTDPSWKTWELRSSTALQGPAQDAVPGFFVHQIRLEGDPPAPVWWYLKYQYSLSKNKFEPERDQAGNLLWVKAD